ncbi:MAG: PSD1 domain-containing protein [Verrucomicrobiaceae bacterium]|nr:PSD1 domain-containing protein [Verrucomicrobiaceae bacterium]
MSAFSAGAAERVQFNRDVRPILSDKCFHCHGPDDKKREAGLRLDVRAEALKKGESGSIAIVPGKPELSAVVERITTTAADDIMPPPKMHKAVTTAEIDLLRRWIAEGAEYQGHWAFEPVRSPKVPQVAGAATPVDAFIRARLAKDGLAPSPEADKATQIRRVTLDLVGLPPTPEEVRAFVADSSPKAYEALVDRLLASQQYGEHMARQWLDFARFADSNGFQTDSSRSMWPWRDWVIRAFNDNLPYDQFTVQQVAGDLLPNATQDQIVATGFNRNHRINGEGGIIAEEWRIENIIDRVETTSFTWLGLTLNCCRCHDHKYDPFSQKDFYSFFAFFNNVEESGTIQGASNRSGGNSVPFMKVTTAEQKTKLDALQAAASEAGRAMRAAEKELPKLVAAWEPTVAGSKLVAKSAWQRLDPENIESKFGATLTRQADGSYLASGTNPAKDVYVFDAAMPADGASAFLLECFPDPSLPNQSLGRNSNGNFVLTDFDVFVQKAGGKPVKQTVAKAIADYSQKGYEIGAVLDKKSGRGWAIDGPTKRDPRRAMFVLEKPLPPQAGAKLLLRLRHEAIANHNIGRFRLSSAAADAVDVKLDGDTSLTEIKLIVATPFAKRSPAQVKSLHAFFRANVDSPLRAADRALAAATSAVMKYEDTLPTTMVMKEAATPRDAFILTRGEYDKPAAKVTMATPAVLPPMPKGAPLNRLGLAQWLVAPENPLTARVWVNRAWERFFGNGLCKTTENLGSQAEYPVHPELLDWLAAEFMRSGWDMKAMMKLMVMSQTYRQSSAVTPAMVAADPENRFLARGPRFRLTGEVVRDQALAIGGLLVPKIGGPSVRPYMPEGVWDETSKYGDLRGYKADAGEGLYRRTLYTIWKRTAAPPTMMLFDAPTREICTVKRSRTNTPLQALALLNEVTFVEAARGLAQLMIQKGGATPEERLRYGYLRATAQELESPAMAVLLKGLKERLAWYQAHSEDAAKLVSQGQSKPAEGIAVPELAAYCTTASVLMNLDRVVTRQ